MTFRFVNWLLLGALVLTLTACGSDSDLTATQTTDPGKTTGGTATVFAQFDANTLPLPNDVTWAADGNPEVDLAISPDDSAELAGLKTIVNNQVGLLGLSPNMFLTLPLTGSVDSTTLDLLIFRTDDPNLPALLQAIATNDLPGIGAAISAMELRDQTDFVIVDDVASGVVKLLPKTPFTPGAAYAVAAKNTLMDSNGFQTVSSFTMEALKSTTPFLPGSPYLSFEPVRAGFNDANSTTGAPGLLDIIAAVTGAGAKTSGAWTRSDILVAWTFHTASNTLSLTPTVAGSDTVDYPGGAAPFTQTKAALKGLSALTTTNNLSWTNPADGSSVTAPLGIPASTLFANTPVPTSALGNVYSGTFESPLLDQSGMATVPFRLTVPSIPGPWPVVLFQHGITSSKDAALGIANSLAQAGFATLAVDAIFHGERTTTGAESGDGFFTTNLVQDRANIYQAAIDLWEAVDVINAGMDLDGDTFDDLDATNTKFIAHSLGSIIGSVFLSQETRVNQMVLSSPSAILVNALDETALPSLQALVTALGFTPGTTSYYVFLNLAQWLLDPTDGTYNGIGTNSTNGLMSLYAFDDPIVPPSSSQVFFTNLVPDQSMAIEVEPGVTAPASTNGTYQYGVSGKPVVHSFLLSPAFDVTTDPWYAGYDSTVQLNATGTSQAQVATFLATGVVL